MSTPSRRRAGRAPCFLALLPAALLAFYAPSAHAQEDPEALVVTSADVKVLPFEKASMTLTSSHNHRGFVFIGPIRSYEDRLKPSPWAIHVSLPRRLKDGVLAVAAPKRLREPGEPPEAKQAHLAVADHRTPKPTSRTLAHFQAVAGTITVAGYRTKAGKGMFPIESFSVTVAVEVRAVEGTGAAAKLTGPSIKLTGSFRVGEQE